MASRDLAVGIFFLLQTALGMLGNSALLCCFVIADFAGIRAKPTDLIVKHLTWANFLVLLCKGMPHTMEAFRQTYYLGYISCKLALYFHRVARGVSLSSTSLLSVIQAITISPNNSKWKQLKIRAPRIIGPSLGLCWSLQLLIYVFILVYTTDIQSGVNITGRKDFGYCAVVNPGRLIDTFNAVLLTSSDAMFLGLMVFASGSMVFRLLKHKQRVQHTHRSQSPRSSAETSATHIILTIVSSFVLFYVASIVFTSYVSVLDVTIRWLVDASAAMSACFPAFCPFVLLRQHTSVFKLAVPVLIRPHCVCVVRDL
ncbi:vomeronasal type-1 receptor 4-like [Acomys russatus]|uniref:vomeronasal type-1 receptor 4-like n=1 Tax=Acomys russatus TaxID=60746 RepID=UPI0021E22E4F|nr:vomeronasal type-1 receptor 4-like [Acomys russatus]